MVNVRIAVPSKGRLAQPSQELLESAGIRPVSGWDTRSLMLPTNLEWVTIVRVRPEDIPFIVAECAVDLGITGLDFVVEAEVDVEVMLDLGFGKASLVLAVPEKLGVKNVDELPSGIRIATKYVNIARRFVESHGIKARIIRVSGSTEVIPLLGAADAVIDVMSSGVTLAVHGLKPIAKVLETSARLIACKKSLQGDKSRFVRALVELVKSVIEARRKKLVLMNVPDKALRDVLEVLPAMAGPSVAKLERTREPMWEVITVVDEDELARVILEAREKGARDIVVVPIEKVVR